MRFAKLEDIRLGEEIEQLARNLPDGPSAKCLSADVRYAEESLDVAKRNLKYAEDVREKAISRMIAHVRKHWSSDEIKNALLKVK